MAKNKTKTVHEKLEPSSKITIIGKPDPKTDEQARMVESFEKNIFTVVNGVVGSGKTMLACQQAAYMLETKKVDKIILTRSAHETGGRYESIGFLPGDIREKLGGAMYPMIAYFEEIYGSRSTVETMISNGTIEILPIGHLMGRTFKNCVVIFDECQLSGPTVMRTLMGRVGYRAKVFAIGDVKQNDDMPDKNGLQAVIEKFANKKIRGFGYVQLTKKSILRSNFVKDIENVWDGVEPVEPRSVDSDTWEYHTSEDESQYLLDRAENTVF